jgi:hypothetical protein
MVANTFEPSDVRAKILNLQGRMQALRGYL